MDRMTVQRALIPASGYGTRLLPASRSVPKEMLPVFDRPCLQFAIDEATSAGIRRFGIVTMRGKSALEEYLDPNQELDRYLRARGQEALAQQLEQLLEGLEFAFVRQPGPRGLGDAVLSARPLLGTEPFAVLLADDVIDQTPCLLSTLIDLHAEVGGAVIALQEVPPQMTRLYGIVRAERTPAGHLRVVDLVEKPEADAPSNLAVVGRYVLPPEILDLLEDTPPGRNAEIQLTDALSRLARSGKVHAVMVQGRRFDAGSPLGMLEAALHFAWKRPELRLELTRILAGPWEETR